jgi:ABC-type transport system substrate-binding protein
MKRRDFLLNSTAVMGGGMLMGSFALPAAAQDTPVSGGTLIWGHSETTQNLDMHQTGTASSGRVLQNIHSSIVTVDKDLNVIPGLAESFEVAPDGLTYTFKLRPNVKFHNGATMTSADVKYSFERCKDPATGAVNFEVFNNVASIETPDDLTVVIKMSAVNAPFLSRLAENGAGVVMPVDSGPTQGTNWARGRSSSSATRSAPSSRWPASTTTGKARPTLTPWKRARSPSPPRASPACARASFT